MCLWTRRWARRRLGRAVRTRTLGTWWLCRSFPLPLWPLGLVTLACLLSFLHPCPGPAPAGIPLSCLKEIGRHMINRGFFSFPVPDQVLPGFLGRLRLTMVHVWTREVSCPPGKPFFRKDKNKSTLQKNVISFTGDHRCPSHVSLGLLAHGWLRSRDRGSWLGSTGLPHLGCQTLRVIQPCTSIVCSQPSCSPVLFYLEEEFWLCPLSIAACPLLQKYLEHPAITKRRPSCSLHFNGCFRALVGSMWGNETGVTCLDCRCFLL